MNRKKAGSSDEFFIGVIKQAHNGPVRVVSMAASGIEEAREKCNRLCGQLTPKPEHAVSEKDIDPNTSWSTLVVVNVDDIRTVEGLSVSMKVVHDNKYGNRPDPDLKLITHTTRGEA